MIKGGGLVKQLGYVGGQNKGLKVYCVPLIFSVNGSEKYVLKLMSQYRDQNDSDNVKNRYKKLEFTSRGELMDAFKGIKLKNEGSFPWQETNNSCGYTIPEEEFEIASLFYDISREDRRS
jgi:hypothetical protein